MKHFLKKHERFLSVYHYIALLRRQPEHLQHLYAIIFAGSITILLAAVILYVDYGFWHEKYSRADGIEVIDTTEPMVTVRSPGDMIGSFFTEASNKLKTIDVSASAEVLTGKETYTNEEDIEMQKTIR